MPVVMAMQIVNSGGPEGQGGAENKLLVTWLSGGVSLGI